MFSLLALVLTAPCHAAQDAGPDVRYHRVPVGDLEWTDQNPPRHATSLDRFDRLEQLWPRVVLEDGEAWYAHRWWDEDTPTFPRPTLEDGEIFVRSSAGTEIRGTLYLPMTDWSGVVRLPFSFSGPDFPSTEKEFLHAEAQNYGLLARREIPGAAWFRYRFDALEEELEDDVQVPSLNPWRPRRGDDDLVETYELFSGGRALSENLQLDRLIPESEDDGSRVPLEKIQGITMEEIDWAPLLEGIEPPEADPLARLVPADQHGVFFPSFDAAVAVFDELELLGEPLLDALEDVARDAGTRERYETQLCLPLDGITRLLGPRVVRSIALTGSDLYLRRGSDVAVLMETADPEALSAFIRVRQDAATGQLETRVGDVVGVAYRGVVSPGRRISSYVAQIGDTICVTNSLVQLEILVATFQGHSPNLGDTDEYRYFRARYSRGDASETGFAVLPDAAIRRWCGPRWRIAASRRTRAAAVLADRHARELVQPAAAEALARGDDRYPIGALVRTDDGLDSPIYGTLSFMRPIAELDIAEVTGQEAALYRRWRDGYQFNWARFFDPIAARIELTDERAFLDLLVMPLIEGTDYDELRDLAGSARLKPLAADPHDSAAIQFALAIDLEADTMQELRSTLGGIIGDLGPNPLSWMAGSVGIYFDHDEGWEEILLDEDEEEAREDLSVDWNELPLAVHFDVASGLKLATFLGSVRTFSEKTMPGLLEWSERSASSSAGEHRYVGITSSGIAGDDVSVFYGTTPEAWVISLHEPTLVNALERLATRTDEVAASAEWIGESVSLSVDRSGIRLIEILADNEYERDLRRLSFENLPILNEWRRRDPACDPVARHQELWGEALRCPGGGEYTWNEAFQTMESTVFGHPGEPRGDVDVPPVLSGAELIRTGLTFEENGLRVRAELIGPRVGNR